MTQDMVKMMSQDKMIGKREILSSSPSPWLSRFLRTMLLLLMLTLRVNVAWGQDTDYSGTYYIGSKATKQNNTANSYTYNSEELANNYYLCPTEGWYFYNGDNNTNNGWTETDNGKPFLTTYKCLEDGEYDVSKAVWVIEKKTNTDFYYIKQKKTTANEKNRYLVSNKQIKDAGVRRMRVHLEEFADNETAFASLGDLALFEITTVPDNLASNCLYIMPHSADGRVNKEPYLVVNDGNYNNLKAGVTKNDGPNSTYTQGTIGVYSTEPNGYWTLEVPRPVISFNASNQVEITDPTGFASAIYYTTNGDDPAVDPSNLYSAAFDPDDDVTTIKAIAIVDGKESGVATFTPPFFLGSTHNYIIQSKDCKFYNMIPNLSVDENTKNVSTLNVPCSTMAWHFEYAEKGYYYIVDVNGWYMYYTTTSNTSKYIYLKSNKDDSDGFKFNITAHTNGGFSIIPKGQTKPIYKPNGGTDPVLQPVKYEGTLGNAVARWDIIPYSTTNLPMWETSPFNVSTDDVTNYYTITPLTYNSETDWRPIIINSSGDVNSENVPEGLDSRKTMWIIKKVAAYDATDNPTGDNSDLLDYYTIQNAYTGELIYYNGNGNGDGRFQQTPTFQMGEPSVTGADETWSHFVIVQTANNGYNIIPRIFVDNVKAVNRTSTPHYGFNCINRSQGDDILGTFFDDGSGSRWTFDLRENVKCLEPVFTETDNVITLSCITNASEIFFTNNGEDPTAAGVTPTKYTNQTWPSSEQVRIRAYAKLISDNTSPYTSASDVVTLLNKPDITLGGTAPYIYKASPWEPGVTEVSIGEAPNKTSTTSGYSIAYSESHTDAGEVTVTVTDNVEDDLFIKNASTTFTIQRKDVNITANNASKPYDGEPLTESGFTAGDLETGDTHTFTVAMTAESTITDAGTQPNEIATVDGVSVTTGTETVVGNYLVKTANGTLTVNPASVTLTANSRNTDVYDGTEKTVTGFTCKLGEQTVEGLTFEGVSASGSGTNAGDYDVTFTGVTVNETKDNTGNYVVIGTTDGILTIKPASVTLTAKSRNTDVYDGTEKTVTGFICKMDEQTVEGLTFAESVAASGSGTNAGEYDVTFTGVILNETKDNTGNYIVTGTTDGTLTITAKEITIGGITAENKEYDGTTDAVLVYTDVTFTGKLDSDDLTVSATGAFTDKNVGTGKTVNITGLTLGGTDAANYTYNGGDLTATAKITRASVTVTADNKTKEYGDDDPELTWTVDGLKGTDTEDVLTVSMSRTEGEDVSTTITITPSGDAEQGNYNVSYVTGTLTITAKAIGDETTPADGIDIDITYDGTNYTVTVKQGENILQQGTDKDYTCTLPEGNPNPYVVTINGQNNYTSSAKATYIKQTFYDTTPDQALTTETTAAVYCASQNLKVNETFEAYYVTKLENNTLTITKVEAGEGENKKNYIPEGQPVLLISETNPAPKGFTLKPYTGTGTDLGEGANLLKVVTDDGGKNVNLEEVYIFSMGEFVLNKAGKMSKGKFYLENPNYNTSSHSRSFLSITSGDVTGINTSQLSDTDSQIPDIWYTIGGQKLLKKPTRKGIYLQNGNKVVIK